MIGKLEVAMSIADLKVRLSDVPRIETLFMALEVGRIIIS
jgi:hypothetical protein